ncbi:hypothetical protein [Streptomyces sp. NBC_01443]|uniref:hypothetical protein n=1 Tax=Streptomyces sp. NBC_01443 TaxID=2903868 RepID=UPI00225648FC|nr:hypothetical protein [Streptomyces sp. NBC_01443]MCX4629010.1 hypothetical protein [Streptomyces sp. NBC_01443]
MTDRASSAMLERLRAVEWTGDWDDAVAHVMSRRVLMREYLRRAGMWAQAYSAESAWPFFDVTDYVDPQFTLPPEIATELQEFLDQATGGDSIKRTCAGAVRMAGLSAQDPLVGRDLPDLYEPLVLFYERGGEFLSDNAGFLDLTGVLLRPGTLQGHLGTPHLSSLEGAMLDALDAAGRITYYMAADRRGPLLRQRVVRGDQSNEAFSRDSLHWAPTGALPAAAEKAADFGLVWLDEMEAADFIATALATPGL